MRSSVLLNFCYGNKFKNLNLFAVVEQTQQILHRKLVEDFDYHLIAVI